MQGLMQDFPLTLPHFFDRAKYLFPEKEIVTATFAGPERTNYGTWAERTQRLGGVLDDLGISEDGRVADPAADDQDDDGRDDARELSPAEPSMCRGRPTVVVPGVQGRHSSTTVAAATRH